VVRRYAELADLASPPPLLFVAASHVGQMRAIQGRLSGAPTLVIGDREEPSASVSFRLTPEGNVRFDVNLRECESRGLRISSEVLKLARIVGTPRS
jgi:hypothetical protein